MAIISASRRTDVLAFYSEWFMNRVRDGYCTVPNPRNLKQVSKVSLDPADVDCFVFWTRWPKPLFPYLGELDDRGYHYYFQYTIVNYPRFIDPKSPSKEATIKAFKNLSNRLGPGRLIWRYDPVIFSDATDIDFHLREFTSISAELKGYCQSVVVSIMDEYPKAKGRMKTLQEHGFKPVQSDDDFTDEMCSMFRRVTEIAGENDMRISSCAEKIGMVRSGINPGRCVDNVLIQNLFGVDVDNRKHKVQRNACGCVASREIGLYDTCLFGCTYCYATRSFDLAKKNYRSHDPNSPSLVGGFEPA